MWRLVKSKSDYINLHFTRSSSMPTSAVLISLTHLFRSSSVSYSNYINFLSHSYSFQFLFFHFKQFTYLSLVSLILSTMDATFMFPLTYSLQGYIFYKINNHCSLKKKYIYIQVLSILTILLNIRYQNKIKPWMHRKWLMITIIKLINIVVTQ